MKTERDVVALLGLFVSRNNRKMERLELDLYLGGLNDIGWPKVYAALENLFKSTRGMPTIDEIREAAGNKTEKPVSDNELVQDAISRIRQAVSRYGMPNEGEAKRFVGDLGWAIVQRTGGWYAVCAPESYTEFDFLLKEAKQTGISILKAQNLGIDRPLTRDDTKPKLGSVASDTIKRLADAARLK